jgi:hypothetical protein
MGKFKPVIFLQIHAAGDSQQTAIVVAPLCGLPQACHHPAAPRLARHASKKKGRQFRRP